MIEMVIMLTVLRSAEVVGKPTPINTCEAVRAAVEVAKSDKYDLKHYWPDRPMIAGNEIIQVSCVRIGAVS